ncbi:acyl-CoA thioester hydrolase [Geosporobacter subterraneus DSM 17957]|uniref:Acyl-CoA thioester hydrolase n=1 Tax=Geosporobacter subterraneus DSM 17957 TaxID=1121919 RepID=A0A1M6JD94_9FIRM|nr:thioesterase family protein [Geosporobacter subterraneus]SHJ44633.1 acyl-CoA thioester hydrolase [Geosporobacter subterraneus DSM 17957]
MHINDARVRVRYKETDQMGVVYHGNYYTWFEVGRAEFFRSLGYTYKKLEKEGIIMPVIESQCFYRDPAKYDDELMIRTRIKKLKGVRLEFAYQIIRRVDEEILAEGKTVHAFVDRQLKPVNFKKVNPSMWKLLQECIEE